MRISIRHLFEHPEHVEVLARWLPKQFGHEDPQTTIESRIRDLEARRSKDRLPMTLIALHKNQLVGSYSLDLKNMEDHPELLPWLANVYVSKAFRSRGIGSLLMKDALKRALQLKIPKLHLFTSTTRASWYENFGWQRVEKEIYRGKPTVIMEINL